MHPATRITLSNEMAHRDFTRVNIDFRNRGFRVMPVYIKECRAILLPSVSFASAMNP